jgi:hypothetical protein
MYDAFYDRLSGKEVDVAAYEDILEEYNWDKIAETWKKKFNNIM